MPHMKDSDKPVRAPAVVVTGASTGIGEACVHALHAHGFHVFAGVRKAADGERLAAKMSDRCTPLILNVTDESQIAHAAGIVLGMIGPGGLHGLVNNAGIVVAGPAEFLPIDEIRRQLEVNVIGQIAVTQAFLPALRESKGRIVFMGSSSGYLATPFLAPYAMSKFAIEALGDSWRVELRRAGIRVSIVQPGAIKTPIWEKSRDAAEDLAAKMPAKAQEYYGAAFDRLREHVKRAPRVASPASSVSDAVLHALTARRPRTRYPVGLDARMQAVLARMVPDRLRDFILSRLMWL